MEQNKEDSNSQKNNDKTNDESITDTSSSISLQECNLINLSKTQLIEMIQRAAVQNKDLLNQLSKAKDLQAKISNKGEAEEEFISNLLAQKLEKIQKEKQDLLRKVQGEEEHINNYLHKKLNEIQRERIEIEAQLEDEQTFLLQTLNKQLRHVKSRIEALKKKLDGEQREKQELIDSIEKEQKYLKDTLQKKLENIQIEKESLLREITNEESERIANLQLVIERILTEKNKLEELLSQEVREKQQLVMALENQKSSVTIELQNKIEEIKKHRSLIQKKLEINKQSQDIRGAMSLQNKQKASENSNNSTPTTNKTKSEITNQMKMQIGEMDRTKSTEEKPVKENTVDQGTSTLLKRDIEYYELEKKRTMQKILSLTTQLEDVKHESDKYKKIWDNVKQRLKRGDQMQYQQMMMQITKNDYKANMMNPFQNPNKKNQIIDSSVENSCTDSDSSFMSCDSGFIGLDNLSQNRGIGGQGMRGPQSQSRNHGSNTMGGGASASGSMSDFKITSSFEKINQGY